MANILATKNAQDGKKKQPPKSKAEGRYFRHIPTGKHYMLRGLILVPLKSGDCLPEMLLKGKDWAELDINANEKRFSINDILAINANAKTFEVSLEEAIFTWLLEGAPVVTPAE